MIDDGDDCFTGTVQLTLGAGTVTRIGRSVTNLLQKKCACKPDANFIEPAQQLAMKQPTMVLLIIIDIIREFCR